jgi:hypothetical protein
MSARLLDMPPNIPAAMGAFVQVVRSRNQAMPTSLFFSESVFIRENLK